MFKEYQKYLILIFFRKFINTSFVFLSLIFILNLLEEINFFKDLDANFLYPYLLTLFNTPITLFEIFPFIFILSTQFFFYDLHKNDELNLLKKIGLSNFGIIKILFLLSLLIGIFNVLVYYNIASKLKFYYSDIKNNFSNDNKYLAMVTDSGLWIKDEKNNRKYIIKSNYIYNEHLYESIISELNNDFQVNRVIKSNKINIKNNDWIIFNPIISKDNSIQKINGNLMISTNFNSKKINNLFSDLSSLNIFQLFDLKEDFKKLGYSSDEFLIQLLKLFTIPIIYGIFTIFSATIMFNLTKNSSLLTLIITGVFISVIIYYVNFIFNSLGENGKIPIYPSIFFPIFFISILSMIGLVNINDK
jgi:lipopolysaccharide export system permease protein